MYIESSELYSLNHNVENIHDSLGRLTILDDPYLFGFVEIVFVIRKIFMGFITMKSSFRGEYVVHFFPRISP